MISVNSYIRIAGANYRLYRSRLWTSRVREVPGTDSKRLIGAHLGHGKTEAVRHQSILRRDHQFAKKATRGSAGVFFPMKDM